MDTLSFIWYDFILLYSAYKYAATLSLIIVVYGGS